MRFLLRDVGCEYFAVALREVSWGKADLRALPLFDADRAQSPIHFCPSPPLLAVPSQSIAIMGSAFAPCAQSVV